ncbi:MULTISPECIES: hypothetical protein [Ramlibacter]|uniref:Uncharacterized protein n=1 Tax=Ramlibacter pinisoli TaxID=2682844 RepID=A0A6N8ISW4_9BURK|nr:MULTISPECIES: hypothetical protein [Ramlibacter]MBA2964979.1 hypothetical protein [Ramlibacter sp. CGMCC 1.13660]MVQ29944.1 hypothetical protein [Ramlibacter pinisoli]
MTTRLINPTAEDAHWQLSFRTEPYYRAGLGYDDYGPAYRVGYTAPLRRSGRFDELEDTLRLDWERVKGRSRLTWDEARGAVQAAWARVCDEEVLAA